MTYRILLKASDPTHRGQTASKRICASTQRLKASYLFPSLPFYPWKFNLAPKNWSSPKESSLPTIHFSWATLNFWGVSVSRRQEAKRDAFLSYSALMNQHCRHCQRGHRIKSPPHVVNSFGNRLRTTTTRECTRGETNAIHFDFSKLRTPQNVVYNHIIY